VKPQESARIVVLVSANAEWTPTKETLKPILVERSPYGEFFTHRMAGERIVFFHGGWGKIAAAASTEYAIATWRPQLLINFGTCGGIEGRIERGERLLVTRAVTYDIREAIGDSAEAIRDYTTDIDLAWIAGAFPMDVRRATLISGDRDLIPSEISDLVSRYSAVAADWESSAIAHVAKRREVRLLILRAVSDLVHPQDGEATGNLSLFQMQAATIMRGFLGDLPKLIEFVVPRLPNSSSNR
jgi:adenosylhomocysteine nucleosidase